MGEAGDEGYWPRAGAGAVLRRATREGLVQLAQAHTPLPDSLLRGVRAYLRCGVLRHGFVRVCCEMCGEDVLVGFSCKGCGFCPRRDRMKKKLGGEHLAPARRDELLAILARRFEQNSACHPGLRWEAVRARLEAHPEKLWSLDEMEKTGGEPDVVARDEKTGEVLFYDCSVQSPKGRRSLCYDDDALRARKEHKPRGSAIAMAAGMAIEILTEEEYRKLQELGEFDTTTSSWVKTPPEIRRLGGALFCDRRYGKVFVYHNGAESYYAARGFRGALRV